MNQENFEEFRKSIKMMVMHYERFEPTFERVAVYFDALRIYSLEDVNRAIRNQIKKNKFVPRASEIIDEIIKLKFNFQDIEEVGPKIREAMRRFGYNAPKKAKEYLGEEIWDVVDKIGWYSICSSNTERDLQSFIYSIERSIKSRQKNKENQEKIGQTKKSMLKSFFRRELKEAMFNDLKDAYKT